ncbi:MAG: Protein phosphatase 2C 1 [Thelocarpon impressellum]|nr:MAG: Protein phosphatase 2C 1 [Thelocarpon impressellum]
MFGGGNSSSSSTPPTAKDADPGGGPATGSSRSTADYKTSVPAKQVPDGVTLSLMEISSGEKRTDMSDTLAGGRATDDGSGGSSPGGGDKKRRSSKASSLIASAKNSLSFSGSGGTSQSTSSSSGGGGGGGGGGGASHNAATSTAAQTPLQKLGRKDPALAVPQGPQNNSAGESLPGARSTFRVGVTEDKNKKCRRTMEDTHSYLYNFLSTPAPDTGGGGGGDATGPAGDSTAGVASAAESGSNVVETDNGYFAVFDGHAGTFAADWCGKKLHIILEEAIRKNPNTPIPELLDQTFTSVDQQLDKLPLKNSGCTAVTAVLRWEDRIPNKQSVTGSTAIAPATAAAVKASSDVLAASSTDPASASTPASASGRGPSPLNPESDAAAAAAAGPSAQARLQDAAVRHRVLYTANVGDARIVLCRNGKALRLSYDHKGSDENEGKRVANAGGLILNNRVNGVLAVTRALGDAYMKDLVTGHPYTTETVIQPEIDEFIILACDGLWDVCSDQEAVDLVRNQRDPQLASKMLVDHALARFSTDNLSCMIVRFDNKAVQKTAERKADAIGVEGDPPTRKGGISEADAIVLDARRRSGEGDAGPSVGEIAEADEGEPGPEPTAGGGGGGGGHSGRHGGAAGDGDTAMS